MLSPVLVVEPHFKRFVRTLSEGQFNIGLVIGSIVVVFPGWSGSISLLLLSVGMFAAGLFVAYILGRVEYED